MQANNKYLVVNTLGLLAYAGDHQYMTSSQHYESDQDSEDQFTESGQHAESGQHVRGQRAELTVNA